MTDLIMTNEITVKLIDFMGSDRRAFDMARVSLTTEEYDEVVQNAGRKQSTPATLLPSLMELRHGVPFEHCVATVYAEVPISTARQWVKHRMSSLNEKSGRYGKLLPKFYSPGADRPMINEASRMHPKMVQGSPTQVQVAQNSILEAAAKSWQLYEFQLKYGIAEELARNVLPVGIYTQFVWTVNMRGLMNFLERRIDSPDNRVETHPQWEIQLGALQLEEIFKEKMPIAHQAFVRYGRVAP